MVATDRRKRSTDPCVNPCPSTDHPLLNLVLYYATRRTIGKSDSCPDATEGFPLLRHGENEPVCGVLLGDAIECLF